MEIPQVQSLDTVFGDCGYWHIDKAVDVPLISKPLLLDIFIHSGIQLGQRSFTISSSPLDDDHGLGDDDDFLECGAAEKESKMEEVSDWGFSL